MSDEFVSFAMGAALTAIGCVFIPSTSVLGIESEHATKVCAINDGVESVRGAALRDGKVVCNNGATFYYSLDKIRAN